MRITNAVVLFHTVRYLKPVQIFGRLWHVAKSRLLKSPHIANVPLTKKIEIMIPELDTDESFTARFKPDTVLQGSIHLLNKDFLPDYTDYPRQEISPLERFNLGYFEYAVAFGSAYKQTGDKAYADAFETLYRQYIKQHGKYHAYVVSLQTINILIAMELFGNALSKAFLDDISSEMYKQYRFLINNQESYLLGNHYLENLKAIIILSCFFDERDVYRKHIGKLKRQISEQILDDGMHFELSPLYHKLILEDMLRLWLVGEQCEWFNCDWLKPVIQKMTDCACSLEKGIGRTPLFNDSGDNVAKPVGCLLQACERILGIIPVLKDAFPASGYYKLYDKDIGLIFDAGAIGPSYMPGHGHCDCLSFELSVRGMPLFVNSGTYQYQGELRKYYRSTKAHNTVMVGDAEQSECWGEHRVARRISNISAIKNGQLLIGEYKNFYGDKHTRMISLMEKVLSVLDSIKSDNTDMVHSYLHLGPGYVLNQSDNDILVFKDNDEICRICSLECEVKLHTGDNLSYYSEQFGTFYKTGCIEFCWQCDDRQHGYIVQLKS